MSRRNARSGALMVVAALGVATCPSETAAQSILSSAGLGTVTEPLDARARSLGGNGIGQPSWYLLPTDPGAASGLVLPTIGVSLQPTSATLTDGRSAGQARFPTVGASFPLWGNVFSVGFASAFDQRWSDVTARVVDLDGTLVDVVDAYRSSGNVSRVYVGWARLLRPGLGIGLNLGSYLGAVDRTFTRAFDAETAGEGVEPFVATGRWRASGIVVSAGVTWDPTSLIRVSGSVTWSNELDFSPSTSGTPDGNTYSIPLEWRAGASATLLPGVSISAGLTYADWATVGEELGGDAARSATWSYGGGLEWARISIWGRSFPLRIGARHQDLPFHFDGAEAEEQTLTAGFGIGLVETETIPIARLDVAFEWGTRDAGSLSESFLRTTFSLRLAGN